MTSTCLYHVLIRVQKIAESTQKNQEIINIRSYFSIKMPVLLRSSSSSTLPLSDTINLPLSPTCSHHDTINLTSDTLSPTCPSSSEIYGGVARSKTLTFDDKRSKFIASRELLSKWSSTPFGSAEAVRFEIKLGGAETISLSTSRYAS